MATSTGATTKALITGIAYFDTREVDKRVFDVACEDGFDDLMTIIGGYRPTEQPNYHHFVDEDLFQVLAFDTAGVSGSPGVTLTVTITSTGYARRGLKLKFADGKVGYINSGITTASNKDSFTIKSVDGTNLTAAAGDKVSSMGIVMGEGSDEVDDLTYGATKYFNLVEHLKDKIEITDIQEASKVMVGTGYEAYRQAVNQAQSFKTQISATLIGGVKSVNEYGTASPSIIDKYGNSMQTTGGLDAEINAYGVAGADLAGTFNLTTQDTLCDQLNAVKAPADYIEILPDSAKRKKDTYWKNLGSSGLTSARLNFDGNEKDFNVSKIGHGRYNFQYASLAILNHPQIFNFTGGPAIGKTAYGMPTDKVKVQVGPGGKGGSQYRIGVRYLPNAYAKSNQGTAWIREWYTGANNMAPTSGKEVKTCHISTTQGFEGIGTKQMYHQKVLS